jgi:hypothetical protein
MKKQIKEWLMSHKGKSLTPELIDTIASSHEHEIGDMLANEGLMLVSEETGKRIKYGRGVSDDCDWSVEGDYGDRPKGYKTLTGAIKSASSQVL